MQPVNHTTPFAEERGNFHDVYGRIQGAYRVHIPCFLQGCHTERDNQRSPESVKQMLEDTDGGFDVVFEAVGAAETLNMCIEAVKPGGEIVMVGNSIEPQISVDVNRLVLKEVKLHGSVSCTRTEFTETINLIASGMVDAESFVTDIVPLDDLQHTFERLTDHNDPILKAVVKP